MNLPLVVLGLLTLVGCGAAGDAVDTVGDTHTTSLHGVWRGSDEVDRPASVAVTHRALSAEVELVLEGHPCVPRSTLEAKVTTSGVEGHAQIGGMSLELSGDPGLSEMIGNFKALSDGPCPQQGDLLVLFRR